MQHMQMQTMMPPYSANGITTDHIQQYLDENKALILKILENQNSGKVSECAENQARLQRNLMYLAAIADSQPQPPNMHAQYSNVGVPPGAHYLQHQQAQQMTQQSLMAARSNMMYAQPITGMQQQQAMHSQLGMSSGGNSGLQMMHNEGSMGGSGALGSGGYSDYGRGSGGGVTIASKQDGGSGSGEGRGGNSGGQSADGGESLYLKNSEEGN